MLLTLCSWRQLSTAAPLPCAAHDNQHWNIFWNPLITYLFFTWDGICNFLEQYIRSGWHSKTDESSPSLDRYRGIKMSFGCTDDAFNAFSVIDCTWWKYTLAVIRVAPHTSHLNISNGGLSTTLVAETNDVMERDGQYRFCTSVQSRFEHDLKGILKKNWHYC